MDYELAGAVILSGLTIVFVVLILLTLILMGFGKLMGGPGGKGKQEKKPEKATPEAVATNETIQRVVEDGISDETVAVISASIATVLGSRFALRGVKRAKVHGGKGGRTAWGLAGMQQNTSSF